MAEKPKNPFKDPVVDPAATDFKHWTSPRVLHDEVNRPPRSRLSFIGDPGKTDQTGARDSDLNFIMDRFAKTGVLPQARPGVFADISTGMDFRDALHVVMAGTEAFDSLDASTRKRFDNDPALFLDFVEDPKNREECVKMGLASLPPPSDTDRLIGAINASKVPSGDSSKGSKGRAAPKPGTEPGDDA